MPKLKEMWDTKNAFTRSASDIGRNLCFAGLAVIWVFRVPKGDASAIPPALMWCAAGFIVALSLDLIQYVTGAVKVDAVAQGFQDAGKKQDDDVLYPDGHPKLMNRLWGAKLIVTGIFWLLLLCYIVYAAASASLPGIGK